MNVTSSKILSSFKYGYLIIFFVLLSGFFNPIIKNTSFDVVIIGSFVLSIGLAGGILLYKAATSDTKKEIFFASGFALIGISIYYIFEYAGKY